MAQRAAIAWLASDQPERFECGVASLRLERQAIEASPARIDKRLLAPAPDAPWLLITGSGSTGRPKLIPVSHAQGRARSELGARALGLTALDRVAALSHFDFSTSKFRLHEALWAGAACALEIWTDASQVMQRCTSAGLTVLYGTVFHAEKLIATLPTGSKGTQPALPMLRAFELTASTVSDELRQRFWSEVAKGSERQFLTQKLAERDARHKRMGDSRYVVEPNIKDGKGGLRDLQTLYWIGKYVHRVDNAAQLVDVGLLTTSEYRSFRRAEGFLLAARCHMHLITDRAEDRLTFDLQRQVAERMIPFVAAYIDDVDKAKRRITADWQTDY